MTFTLKMFLEENNYAPLSLEEVAHAAKAVEDDDISTVAKKFLKTMNDFEEYLVNIGYEPG